MKCKFFWTARIIKNGKTIQSKYFETMQERDEFVLKNNEWKKRGKICADNLEKHLKEESTEK